MAGTDGKGLPQYQVRVTPPTDPETRYRRNGSLQGLHFYHGTGQDFSRFKIPSWFTTRTDIASIYARNKQAPQVRPVNLAIENPVELSFNEIKGLTTGQVRAYRKAGHDGAVAPNKGETVVVPFTTAYSDGIRPPIPTQSGPPIPILNDHPFRRKADH
ncbi:MAG: hypothetical protein BA869_09715 [Desulfuromonadales bacterium C00003107]|nr:MAG: hypothetical protein BA869_09715 [Desulfuromonadales bacterium C00003107]